MLYTCEIRSKFSGRSRFLKNAVKHWSRSAYPKRIASWDSDWLQRDTTWTQTKPQPRGTLQLLTLTPSPSSLFIRIIPNSVHRLPLAPHIYLPLVSLIFHVPPFLNLYQYGKRSFGSNAGASECSENPSWALRCIFVGTRRRRIQVCSN